MEYLAFTVRASPTKEATGGRVKIYAVTSVVEGDEALAQISPEEARTYHKGKIALPPFYRVIGSGERGYATIPLQEGSYEYNFVKKWAGVLESVYGTTVGEISVPVDSDANKVRQLLGLPLREERMGKMTGKVQRRAFDNPQAPCHVTLDEVLRLLWGTEDPAGRP